MGLLPQVGNFKIDFSHQDRFRLFSFQNVFTEETYQVLQKAFHEVPWVRREEFFYEQYESFIKPDDSHKLASLYDPAFLSSFLPRLEAVSGVRFLKKIKLAAHKLITADAIGIHNDYTPPELKNENYRFIFQFADERKPISGGELTFWESRYTKEKIKTYPHGVNSGVFFQIAPHSFHSVSAVEGERFTLVMYLWEDNG